MPWPPSPPPPVDVGACYRWADASPGNPSFWLEAQVVSLDESRLTARVMKGRVDGGVPEQVELVFFDEVGRWRLHGEICYTTHDGHGDRKCRSDVWVKKPSMEICVKLHWYTPEGCTGQNARFMHQVDCTQPG